MSEAVDFAKHFLLAMPGLGEDYFAGSVIYVCEYSSKGALGLVINRPTDLTVAHLLEKIDLTHSAKDASDPAYNRVFQGGPVQTDRGFVLHSPVRAYNSSLNLGDNLTLTTSRDILQDVADGKAPDRMFVSLGYVGWGAGQLEEEMAQNVWLSVAAEENIIFDVPFEDRYLKALGLLGIDPIMLNGSAGHA
jgi:putative transcriptional regulator